MRRVVFLMSALAKYIESSLLTKASFPWRDNASCTQKMSAAGKFAKARFTPPLSMISENADALRMDVKRSSTQLRVRAEQRRTNAMTHTLPLFEEKYAHQNGERSGQRETRLVAILAMSSHSDFGGRSARRSKVSSMTVDGHIVRRIKGPEGPHQIRSGPALTSVSTPSVCLVKRDEQKVMA